MKLSPKDYEQAIKRLLPTGPAWNREPGSLLSALTNALVQIFARVDSRVHDLIEESYPDSTLWLLPEFETLVGLPDECVKLADTIALRRQDVKARLTAQGGASKQYFTELARSLGYEITITEFFPFLMNRNVMGDPLHGDTWAFVWQVHATGGSYRYFEYGHSFMGEPYVTFNNERLECVFEKYKPAHTIVIFSYEVEENNVLH